MNETLPQPTDTVAIDAWPTVDLAPLNEELERCVAEIEAIEKREGRVMATGKIASAEANKFRRTYGYTHRELDQLVDELSCEMLNLGERREDLARKQQAIKNAMMLASAARERARRRSGRVMHPSPRPVRMRGRSSHRVVRAAASSCKAATGDPLGDPDPESSQRTPQIGGAL